MNASFAIGATSAGVGATSWTAGVDGAAAYVELDRISHFVADHKLTYAMTSDRSHVVDATIHELERRYPTTFVRVHRSALVRLTAIVELHATATAPPSASTAGTRS